jgi:hypothetical protein
MNFTPSTPYRGWIAFVGALMRSLDGGEILTADSMGSLVLNGPAISETYFPTVYLYEGEFELVPKPGTWAPMIGCLTVLVFWQRRKKRLS